MALITLRQIFCIVSLLLLSIILLFIRYLAFSRIVVTRPVLYYPYMPYMLSSLSKPWATFKTFLWMRAAPWASICLQHWGNDERDRYYPRKTFVILFAKLCILGNKFLSNNVLQNVLCES